ncbi:MAG: Ku protein [Gemmatimonadetes bacterium]|nr:MAG: Ku protein [Gemmatimonadota bacterium]
MPARAIGNATISFGLVSVPVQVYSTGESAASVSFNMLHKKCGTRLKQQYICPKDEVVVARDDIAKGYEFAKNQYAVFSPEEIKALDQKATDTIDIAEFVPLAAVDRIYLERAYYVGPDKGGHRAYRLLAEALKETGRAALGQYASRGRQYLVLVRPRDGVLVMEQLHYVDELRAASEVPLGEADVTTDEFRPEKYHDTVRERVLEAIQRKIDGHEITEEPAEAPGAKVIDLMEALKASLAKGKQGPAAEAAPTPRKRKAAGR